MWESTYHIHSLPNLENCFIFAQGVLLVLYSLKFSAFLYDLTILFFRNSLCCIPFTIRTFALYPL